MGLYIMNVCVHVCICMHLCLTVYSGQSFKTVLWLSLAHQVLLLWLYTQQIWWPKKVRQINGE